MATQQNTEPEYKMTISRTTIDKLGVKLYDKASAVVSELIANSYDADAEHVTVKIPLNRWLATVRENELVDHGLEIIVEDDGHGMTPDVVNDFFLKIGNNARTDTRRGPTTLEKGRPRMGRKGIGKLAPFGICKKIEIITAGGEKNSTSYEIAHFIMDFEQIVDETDKAYYPTIGNLNHTTTNKRGTIVKLYDFHHRRTPDEATFHRQVARRFGLELDDFEIIIENTETNNKERIGLLAVDVDEETKIVVDDKPVIVDENTAYPVKGWIAYSKSPYPNEELAGIRVYSRGKFVSNVGIFGLKAGFTGEFTIRSYLVGAIHADWLDSDDHEDIIRSDRQDILWSSSLGMAFQNWGQALIKQLGRKAYPAKKRKAAKKFLEISNLEEEAKSRFMDADIVKTAVAVGKIFARGINEENLQDQEYVDNIKELALSIAPHKTLVDKLREVETSMATRPLEAIARLFNDTKLAEASSLGMMVNERLHNIEKLKAVGLDAPEQVLQKILEGAPWIIDPRWTMLQADTAFKRFRELFERWYFETYNEEISTTTIGRENKRPDFIMIHVRKSIELVEIKKRGHKLENDEFDRLQGYFDTMNEYLEKNPNIARQLPEIHITLICDELNLDQTHSRAYTLLEKEGNLIKKTWDEIIDDAETINKDFLYISQYKPEPH